MNQDERFKFYERLYFHELDRREKINARLSLPFGAMLATVGLLSFMLNSGRHPDSILWQGLFWLLFLAASGALVVGAWNFRRAWFGHTDRQLPTAAEIEAYHAKLAETYDEFTDQKDQLVNFNFDKFLFDYVVRTSSANTINNDNRSSFIFRANYSLTLAVLLSLFAAVPFYIGHSTAKETEMTAPKEPPPPPPPPPERLVKDGVRNPPPPPPPPERRK